MLETWIHRNIYPSPEQVQSVHTLPSLHPTIRPCKVFQVWGAVWSLNLRDDFLGNIRYPPHNSKYNSPTLNTPSLFVKAEHESTCRWPGSIPMGISNSKCYTWIHAGFSHRVTQICESKTHGFSSTCGSTDTLKYLQVLSILNINKVIICKHKYMWNKILLRHHITLWQNQIWLDRPRTSYHQSTLFLSLPLPSHIKNIVSYSSTYQKQIKCSYLGW